MSDDKSNAKDEKYEMLEKLFNKYIDVLFQNNGKFSDVLKNQFNKVYKSHSEEFDKLTKEIEDNLHKEASKSVQHKIKESLSNPPSINQIYASDNNTALLFKYFLMKLSNHENSFKSQYLNEIKDKTETKFNELSKEHMQKLEKKNDLLDKLKSQVKEMQLKNSKLEEENETCEKVLCKGHLKTFSNE